MCRLGTIFRAFKSSNRARQSQPQHENQHHSIQQPTVESTIQPDSLTPSERDSQIIAARSSVRNVSEMEAYAGPCHLLDLPLEIRELVLHWIYGSITVYLRSRPPGPQNTNQYIVWTNAVDWNNPCPGLLLVNHQLRDEALRIVLQNCVLDIWGTSKFDESCFRYLPKIAGQIKYMAITFERLYAAAFDRTMLSSLETLFVDSIPMSRDTFLAELANCICDPTVGHSALTAIVHLMSLEQRTSREGQRPLRIFVRCKTFYEETTFLITDLEKRPETWKQPVVPKFEYKF